MQVKPCYLDKRVTIKHLSIKKKKFITLIGYHKQINVVLSTANCLKILITPSYFPKIIKISY